MKKFIAKVLMLAVLVLPVAHATPAKAATPNWNTTGNYVIAFNYLGNDYGHDMTLTQDGLGNITGNGGSPTGANVYTWVITSGTVSGDTIDFLANYTATADAVTPQTVMHVTGTVTPLGAMTGTWSDNYQGGTRAGTFTTTSGVATPSELAGTLSAEDFGVVNYDSGLGILKGYTAGFGVADNTFTGATSVVVQLFAGTTLLQTNTAIFPKFNTDITGTQFSSPFDVSGTFDYATDGYWTNVRESEYGQTTPATRVVATVTLANGKIVTAENTALVGDGTTVFPPIVTPPTSAVVHIFKYIDGVQATTITAGGVDFPMFTSTYNAPFTLGPAGWTTGDIAYEASTGPMTISSSYSANEDVSTTLVGATCDATHTYSLVGYSTGNTLLEAQAATVTTTVPSFTNLQGDKYIIVQNHLCSVIAPTTGHLIVEKTTNPLLDATVFTITATGTGAITGGGAGTVTDAMDKNYEVVAGTYAVAETATTGWTTTSNTCTNVIVAAGATVHCLITNTKDTVASSISGMKYNDLNRNGMKDTNEPGLAGWVIKLKNGSTVVTATTDASGNYSFTNLASGTYTVRETHKSGWKRMSKNPKPIVITAGSVVTDVNFGNAQKHKQEREDNDNDDNHNDQSGNYYAHNGHSNYQNDQGKYGHRNR